MNLDNLNRGRIVNHNTLIFNDNKIDRKKKRPCILLFANKINDKIILCTCPITSSIKSASLRPKRHLELPHSIYYDKEKSFAKIDTLLYVPLEESFDTEKALEEDIAVDIAFSAAVYKKNVNVKHEALKLLLIFDLLTLYYSCDPKGPILSLRL